MKLTDKYFGYLLCNRPTQLAQPKRKLSTGAFSLVELLVVMAIMAVMATAFLQSFLGLSTAADMNASAAQVKAILENARSYALANNTYVWVGFYEEDGSQPPPSSSGTGRIVISAVASADGTQIYNPDATVPALIDPTRLIEINPLVRLGNTHLKTAISGDPYFPIGNGTGNTGSGNPFQDRPTVAGANAQIGDTSSTNCSAPFSYPVGPGTGSTSPQYTFTKSIQFNPRGEAMVCNESSTLEQVVEIGLQSAHGSQVNTTSPNVTAVQITGIAGNVNVYRP